MRKARVPGNSRIPADSQGPFSAARLTQAACRGPKPSTGIAITKRVTNITGARKKTVEKGFEVAGLRIRRI